VPLDLSSFDVVVCGGGPAGVMAAVASARNGARTLLIERHGFPGGSSTAALVHPWLSFHNKRGDQVLAGLGQELVDRLVRIGGALGHLRDSIGFVYSLTPFDPDLCKQVMLQMLTESGAQVLLHALVVNVERQDERISSVRIVNKSGEFSVGAKVFIDTTGDADVAWQAGAPMQNRVLDGPLQGQLQSHPMLQSQPMTMYFRMSGVDWNPIRQYILDNPHEFHDETLFDDLRRGEPLTGVSGYFSKWRADAEKLGIPRDRLLFFAGIRPDECYINTSRVTQLDGANGFDLSRGEIEGRRQVGVLADWFRREIDGFQNAYISTIPAQIGVRESRRIEGDYILTQDDVISGAKFEDSTARSAYPVDIHAPVGHGLVTSQPPPDWYEIPFRAMLPRGLDNLIVAGRCISATHEGHASTRLTPTCFAMGQAAGTAAALCVRQAKLPRELGCELRDTLRQQGALV